MLSPEERDEIRREVYQELVEIEDEISHRAGTYEYLCLVAGEPTFTHSPIGKVIRRIFHVDRLDCCEVA
jgi:hypothetical protein